MKLGFGLSHRQLNQNHYRYVRQLGCNYVVAHLTDYSERILDLERHRDMYTYDNLMALKAAMADENLVLHALENFCPADWSDVLLDGPNKQRQMDHLKYMIRDVGRAGIPIFGYNFSIAGVYGLSTAPAARGSAMTAVFHEPDEPPIPNGMVWNFVYNPNATDGFVGPISNDELWQRLQYFLEEILPVAEEAGVTMAAHPDDPPVPTLRGSARLVYQPRLYRKLLQTCPSPRNKLEFCLGTLQEMTETGNDIYSVIEEYVHDVAYVHFRNVRGKVPHYDEVFVDEGDIDMIRALKVFHAHQFDGVFIPDHTPGIESRDPWLVGMAYAVGYMKAAMACIDQL